MYNLSIEVEHDRQPVWNALVGKLPLGSHDEICQSLKVTRDAMRDVCWEDNHRHEGSPGCPESLARCSGVLLAFVSVCKVNNGVIGVAALCARLHYEFTRPRSAGNTYLSLLYAELVAKMNRESGGPFKEEFLQVYRREAGVGSIPSAVHLSEASFLEMAARASSSPSRKLAFCSVLALGDLAEQHEEFKWEDVAGLSIRRVAAVLGLLVWSSSSVTVPGSGVGVAGAEKTKRKKKRGDKKNSRCPTRGQWSPSGASIRFNWDLNDRAIGGKTATGSPTGRKVAPGAVYQILVNRQVG